MNNQPENVRGADGVGAGAGNAVGNGAGVGKGGLAGMSLGVSSVSAKKRAEREAAQAKASESGAGGADSAPAAAIPQLDPKDPLAPLWQLDGVAHAADVAAKAIQSVHRHKANLRKHNVTGSESVLRGARASAWLEGGEPSLPDDGNITDPVLAAALRVADTISPESIGETTRVWQRAPQQVLAKFALNASPAGETEDGSEARMKAGRPVGDDKLSSAMKEQRLHVLGDFITGRSQIHAGVLSAIVHGELLTLRPFEYHNGIIARAASRLTTVATGLDPRGLAVPEVYWTRHRQEYVEAAEGFASGSADGLRAWILLHLEGLKAGAVEARGIAEAV
ncbi:hypothetical protein [Corynebacterium sp. HMSC063G05]|uniref:hypothetical protein n=1 Tax=Corynebacterium sp. HMSC063G05 TaxID=1739255 RepID=UPI0009F63F2C